MVAGVVAVVSLLLLGLAVAYWAVVRGRLGGRKIRTRLLYGFVLMAMLPAIAISAGTAAVGYSSGRRQAVDRLQSIAARKESEIKAWVQSVQGDLATTLSTEYGIEEIGVVLDLAQSHVFYGFYTASLRSRLVRYATQSQYQELSLLDLEGQVILSSDITLEGQARGSDATAARESAVLFLEVTRGPSPERSLWLRVSTTVHDLKGQALGSLVGVRNAQALQDVMHERTGLGNSGKAYLVGPEGALLIDSGVPDRSAAPDDAGPSTVHSAGIDPAVASQSSGVAFYDDYVGKPVVGAFRWIPDLQAALLVEEDQAEALQTMTTTLAVNLGIVLACILLAIIASLGITRSIAGPLVRLAVTAERIAGGDLEQSTSVGGRDEVGALARAFNTMTAQLRGLIGRLEERVAERTQALERRAVQLETSARVSREVTSILDIDVLLAQVVELIRSSFGYYHVNVFFVDRPSAELVLRASSGDVTPAIARIPIDGLSLNGCSVLENKPALANSVETDPSFLRDERLPETCSELVVPLRAGEEVVGTLDVQSRRENAFSPEDLIVIQSLADQVAIAIQNARLYEETRKLATLEERHRLARDLHDSISQMMYSLVLFSGAARKLLEANELEPAIRQTIQLETTAQQALREMRLLLYQLRPAALEQDGLKGALQQRLDAVEGRVGVVTQLVTDGELQLAPDVEECLYQIAQEALNNALKHSNAKAVSVRIQVEGGRLVLEIQDDGTGFGPDTMRSKGGLGLASMQERATKVGGSLVVRSFPGRGTSVRVEVRA